MAETPYTLHPTPSPLVVIVGETASGKSKLAIELAERFNGEIICADSWTVRREVNIGTAKPSAVDQKRIPHHLLDIAGPCDDFTAAVFKRAAIQAIEEISNRGKLPIMVGGTGLYIDGVLYDFSFLKAGDRKERQQYNKLSPEDLLAIINERGLSTENIDVRNKRRLIRVLETGGAMPQKGQMRPNTLILGLSVARDELRYRITNRVEDMIQAGLEKEVRNLASKYGWECEALKGIGYKEWREYFDGKQSLDDTKARIIKSTMDLAKRQRTWFKRNKSIQWVSGLNQAIKLIQDFLPKPS